MRSNLVIRRSARNGTSPSRVGIIPRSFRFVAAHRSRAV